MPRLKINEYYNMILGFSEPMKGIYLGNGINGLHQVLVGIRKESGRVEDSRMYVSKDCKIEEDGSVRINFPTLLERLEGPDKKYAEELLSRRVA